MRKNKGITLIALVITIIVMLILVAVTINMAINGGLFGYAGNASAETKNAINSEKQLGENGAVSVDNEEYSSIDDYVTELTKEKYGIREDGKFYCNPASAVGSYPDGDRIYTGLVYDNEHFLVTSYGDEDVYAVWDEGYYRPYGYQDWEL